MLLPKKTRFNSYVFMNVLAILKTYLSLVGLKMSFLGKREQNKTYLFTYYCKNPCGSTFRHSASCQLKIHQKLLAIFIIS